MDFFKKPIVFFILALMLYSVSLALPGMVLKGEYQTASSAATLCPHTGDIQTCMDSVTTPTQGSQGQIYWGYYILFLGWFAILIGNVAWGANVLFFLGCIFSFFKEYKTSMIITLILAGLAFLAGLHSYSLHSFPADEGGVMEFHIAYLGAGFYVWMLSFVCLGVFAFRQRNVLYTQTHTPAVSVNAASTIVQRPEKQRLFAKITLILIGVLLLPFVADIFFNLFELRVLASSNSMLASSLLNILVSLIILLTPFSLSAYFYIRGKNKAVFATFIITISLIIALSIFANFYR